MKKKRITVLLLAICLVCVGILLVTYSLAWYSVNPGTSKALVIYTDGVIYIDIAVDVDRLGSDTTGRVLSPAVAMPNAVANGLPMDVLHTYEDTQNTDSPSYVSEVATFVEYDGEVDIRLPSLTGGTFHFSVEMGPTTNSEDGLFGKEQIIVDELTFSCRNRLGEVVNPVISMDDDNRGGRLYVEEQTNVFFHIKMHLALVDELMDSRLASLDVVYCMVGFGLISTVELEELPQEEEGEGGE